MKEEYRGILNLSVDDFLNKLLSLPGAFDYSGNCSSQVAFRLADGRLLRFGVTDDDVAEVKGLWVDVYEGLRIK